MPTQWRSIKVWMNAFIPRNVRGYTKVVPKGPFKDMTMIPGPFPTSDCFLTDQRNFSPFIQAKSRMHCEARVNLATSTPTITQYHRCDWTTECDCEDGEQECHKQGTTDDLNFSLHIRGRGVIELRLNANAWNPCSPSSQVGGEIDMQATFIINLDEKSLQFVGAVDSFPAFEAYATINDGTGVEIFTLAPPQGNTVMNLPGGARTKIDAAVLYDPGSGLFKKRWTAGLPKFTPLAKHIDLHQGSVRA